MTFLQHNRTSYSISNIFTPLHLLHINTLNAINTLLHLISYQTVHGISSGAFALAEGAPPTAEWRCARAGVSATTSSGDIGSARRSAINAAKLRRQHKFKFNDSHFCSDAERRFAVERLHVDFTLTLD